MRPVKLFLILSIIINIACGNPAEKANLAPVSEVVPSDFKYWTWITAGSQKSDNDYKAEGLKYQPA